MCAQENGIDVEEREIERMSNMYKNLARLGNHNYVNFEIRFRG